MTQVACFPTTYDAKDDQKEIFYNGLNSFLKDIPRSDIFYVKGDSYKNDGNNGNCHVEILGNHGAGKRNAHRELQVEIAQSNGFYRWHSLRPQRYRQVIPNFT
jgi:hypothetical protein